jgi:hypothetical protein
LKLFDLNSAFTAANSLTKFFAVTVGVGVGDGVSEGVATGAGALPPPPPDGAALAEIGSEIKSRKDRNNFIYFS